MRGTVGKGLAVLGAVLTTASVLAQHSYTRAEIENGARLFQAGCATCHGPQGDGVRGVALLSGQFRRAASADIEYGGRMRKVMLWANRNGFWYVLDRTSGEFLSGKPFAKVTWTTGLDAKGRPQNVVKPTAEGTRVFPHLAGATNWYSPSFSPRTGLFYVSAWMDGSAIFARRPAQYVEGRTFFGAFPTGTELSINGTQSNRRLPDGGHGAVLALDPRTGEKKWEFTMADITDAGILTTASDLLFSGGREGFFYALDARTGQLLWKAPVAGIVQAAPTSYAVNGRQYIAIAAGNSLYSFRLRQ